MNKFLKMICFAMPFISGAAGIATEILNGKKLDATINEKVNKAVAEALQKNTN
jgi:uncharacterized membrane protein